MDRRSGSPQRMRATSAAQSDISQWATASQAQAPATDGAPTMGGMEAGEQEGGVDIPIDKGIDWSSAEQVASSVSRATLAGMQQLWKTHAAAMDSHGKAFAEHMYKLHSGVVQDLASIRTFEPREVLAVLNEFTNDVREAVLAMFQAMRQQDDEFAQALYQTTRRAFARNLREALEARDAWHQDKIRGLRQRHEQALATARAAAAVELQAKTQKHQQDIIRLAQREQMARMAAAAGSSAARDHLTMPGTRPATATHGSPAAGSRLGSPGPLVGEMDAAAALSFLGAVDEEESGTVMGRAAVSQLEGALAQANRAIEEMRSKIETLNNSLQTERNEALAWKAKWAQENTKADGAKREALQVVTKCEHHVQHLQSQHLEQLSQRDYILQRCKDTIMRLEAKLQEPTAGQVMAVPEGYGLAGGGGSGSLTAVPGAANAKGPPPPQPKTGPSGGAARGTELHVVDLLGPPKF